MPRTILPTSDITFGWLGVNWASANAPEIVGEAIIAAANHLGDSFYPLVASRELVIRDVEERFATRTNPEGLKWKSWQPPYWHEGTILRRPPAKSTGPRSLYEAVTDPDSYPISTNSLFIERDALYTHYGAAHQQGLGKMPQREFLGPSAVTRGLIFQGIFPGWINNTIAIYERGGRTFTQRRGAKGRFVPGKVRTIL